MRAIGRRTMLVCVLLTALGTPSVGRGAEVDDLKVTAERLIAALNKGDLDTWSTLVHDQAVGFYAISAFPTEGKAALRQNFQGLLSTMENFTITPLNFQYRTIGDTGYVWGHVVVACQATGVEFARTYFLALLARAYEEVEQMEEGLTVVSEALATMHRTGERAYEAELYRLKGELTLQQEARGWRLETSSSSPQASSLTGSGSGGGGVFQKALEIAHQQQARALELQAVMSLSRLWQQQGKNEEAKRMLAKIYSWFTEGFDTKDLQEAKALLAELSH